VLTAAEIRATETWLNKAYCIVTPPPPPPSPPLSVQAACKRQLPLSEGLSPPCHLSARWQSRLPGSTCLPAAARPRDGQRPSVAWHAAAPLPTFTFRVRYP
jgi:hypothetical protein